MYFGEDCLESSCRRLPGVLPCGICYREYGPASPIQSYARQEEKKLSDLKQNLAAQEIDSSFSTHLSHAVTTSRDTNTIVWDRLPEEASLPLALTPVHPKPAYEFCKRLLDIAGSLLLLFLLLPVFLIVSLVIRLTSPGPVLFKQKRPGYRGRQFWCYKFRTMVVDAEALFKANPELQRRFQEQGKIKDDPRITRVGKFLRQTSLDELPQLLNVLQGTMSLIGPRPILNSQAEQYGDYLPKLYSVKPGLGGLWQISGRSDLNFEERIQLDMRYIDHRSLGFDLMLLWRTALIVLRGRGAY